MTKKDYELIANVFDRQINVMEHLAQYHINMEELSQAKCYKKAKREMQQLATSLGFEMAKTNPKFDENKWSEATGANKL